LRKSCALSIVRPTQSRSPEENAKLQRSKAPSRAEHETERDQLHAQPRWD
jgi:hypothetical protein